MFDMSEMICALLESKKHADQIKIIADIIFDGIDSVRGQYWGKALSIYIQMAPIIEVKNKIPALKSRSIISSSEAGRTAIAMSLGKSVRRTKSGPKWPYSYSMLLRIIDAKN